jgi:uncharacterized OB-fold protein
MSQAGRPLPDPEYPDFAPFWQGTARGELRVPACVRCGRRQWPPRMACPACGGLDFAWSSIGDRGRLYSWTTIGRAMLPGFESEVPYTVVIVAAEADPRIRFVGRLDPAHEPPAHEPPAHEPPAHEPPAHEPPAHELPGHELPAIGDPLVAVFVPVEDVVLVYWRPDPGGPVSSAQEVQA